MTNASLRCEIFYNANWQKVLADSECNHFGGFCFVFKMHDSQCANYVFYESIGSRSIATKMTKKEKQIDFTTLKAFANRIKH